MDGSTWSALIAAAAALAGSVLGVLTGDVLAARREQRQWMRRRLDEDHASRSEAYERLLRAAMLTAQSLSVMKDKAGGQQVPAPVPGLRDPNEELLDLRHATRHVVMLGAPPSVTTAAYDLVGAASNVLSDLVKQRDADLSSRRLTTLSHELPHLLRADLYSLVTESAAPASSRVPRQ